MSMANTGATVGSPLRSYLRIGPNEYPIYGGDDCGWSIDEQDFSPSEGRDDSAIIRLTS